MFPIRVDDTLGTILQVLGLVGLFRPLQSIIDVILIVQSVWFVAAALGVLRHAMSDWYDS